MMKYFYLFLVISNIHATEINIISISKNENTVRLEIELFSNEIILLPENILPEIIINDNCPIRGDEYQIFYAFLVESRLRPNKYILVVSNENLGITRMFGRLYTSWLTVGLNYLPYNGRSRKIILLNSIGIPNNSTEKDNFLVDEIFFSLCYPKNTILNENTIVFLENEFNITSITLRLVEPLLFNRNELSPIINN